MANSNLCEKILADGRRCSNPAVPGTVTCKEHGRIAFRLIEKPANTAPQPVPRKTPDVPPPQVPSKPVKKPQTGSKPQPIQAPSEPLSYQAAASAHSEAPRFPGLQVSSERGFLVAPQGLIWLEPDAGGETFNPLVRLLGSFSQATDLPGQVRLLQHKTSADLFLHLKPAKGVNLPGFYDAASSAARLVEARLYIGQEPHFIQYRDDGAPRGYDLPQFQPPPGKHLLLVAHWGSRSFDPTELSELQLSDFFLRVAPQPAAPGPQPETVYALAPLALYRLLIGYLRAHHLRYGLARCQSSTGERLLFEIRVHPAAPGRHLVPEFVLAHLASLPRLALLETVHQQGTQRLLLQRGHNSPLNLAHIAAAFPTDATVIFASDPCPQNLLISPGPVFFDGDFLAQVHAPHPDAQKLSPLPVQDADHLELPVVLRPDEGPTPPTGALLLSLQEMTWLRQLLYRLPGEAFGDYRLCQGREGAVLIGVAHPIQGIPFGTPLRRLGDTQLFIPLRSRFVPELPWALLARALEISTTAYTFLTENQRLDLPVDQFYPLSRALLAEKGRPRVQFDLRTEQGLPPLKWIPPPEPEHAEVLLERPSRRRQGQGGILGGQRTPPVAPGPQPATASIPVLPPDPQEYWKQQAQDFEQKEDFLAAAMCYMLIQDAAASARCLQRVLGSRADTAG